jgi:hypothetical protein
MAHTLTLWLDRFLSSAASSRPADHKPMEIEVERLPDYFWRDLGFQQPRRPDGE